MKAQILKALAMSILAAVLSGVYVKFAGDMSNPRTMRIVVWCVIMGMYAAKRIDERRSG